MVDIRSEPRYAIRGVADLIAALEEIGLPDGGFVLVGGVDEFTVKTMPADDPSGAVLHRYDVPGELTGTGESYAGAVHVHAMLALGDGRVVGGHLHAARVSTHFVHVYPVRPTP